MTQARAPLRPLTMTEPTVTGSQVGTSSLEKIRQKVVRNLDAGLGPFLLKGARFARSAMVTRVLLRQVNQLGVGVRVSGVAPKVDNHGGTIILGDDIMFAAPRTAVYLSVEPGAVLSIGDESWLNDGVWFGCTERITVGRRVLIGPGVRILDNNYHDLYARQRRPQGRPITIEDDVWIASDAIILPGVTIGRGAVVGAKSVVRRDVPDFTVVAGNPARRIKAIDESRFARGS